MPLAVTSTYRSGATWVDADAVRREFLSRIEPENRVPPELEVTTQTEPIVAVRAWRVRPDYLEGCRLTSTVKADQVWEPLERMAARCLLGMTWWYDHDDSEWRFSDAHDAPHAPCQCGIYALTDRPDIDEWEFGIDLWRGVGFPYVMGEVYLWGRVIEAEHGYRAQYAYPKSLRVINGDERIATELSLTYGVPCEVAP